MTIIISPCTNDADAIDAVPLSSLTMENNGKAHKLILG